MVNIFKYISAALGLVNDIKAVKNSDGSINLQAVEQLITDSIDQAEQLVPIEDVKILEIVKAGVVAAIEKVIAEQSK